MMPKFCATVESSIWEKAIIPPIKNEPKNQIKNALPIWNPLELEKFGKSEGDGEDKALTKEQISSIPA